MNYAVTCVYSDESISATYLFESEEKAKDFITDNYLTMIKEHQPCMHILWDDRAKARIIDLNEGINFQAEYFLSRIYG